MIKLYKLTSGEEVIAALVSNTTESIEVEDAVSLVYHNVGEGKMSAGFAPFMPYSEGNITINKSAICGTSEVKAQLLDEYKRVFSAIIQPPSGIMV